MRVAAKWTALTLRLLLRLFLLVVCLLPLTLRRLHQRWIRNTAAMRGSTGTAPERSAARAKGLPRPEDKLALFLVGLWSGFVLTSANLGGLGPRSGASNLEGLVVRTGASNLLGLEVRAGPLPRCGSLPAATTGTAPDVGGAAGASRDPCRDEMGC